MCHVAYAFLHKILIKIFKSLNEARCVYTKPAFCIHLLIRTQKPIYGASKIKPDGNLSLEDDGDSELAVLS